jgi:hypothetical protein
MFATEEGDAEYHPMAAQHTMFLNEVGLEAAAKMVDALNASDAPLRAVQLRGLGGAMARVPVDATAFAHRERKVMAVVVNFYEGPESYERRRKWAEDLAASIDDGAPGAYVNFLDDDGPGSIKRAYPGATGDRLAEIKGRYDPDNVFKLNHNIQPAH